LVRAPVDAVLDTTYASAWAFAWTAADLREQHSTTAKRTTMTKKKDI
jgi:hypothetical protein